MVIYEDTRQQKGKHDIKHEWWASHGVSIVVRKLDFGDYMADGSRLSVDTKRSIDEIAQNLNKDHKRFKNECMRAIDPDDGTSRLVVLVENREGVRDRHDLLNWMNTHCRMCDTRARVHCNPFAGGKCAKHGTQKPIQGPRLAKSMETMGIRYGVSFEFCKPGEAAQTICDILGVEYDEE